MLKVKEKQFQREHHEKMCQPILGREKQRLATEKICLQFGPSGKTCFVFVYVWICLENIETKYCKISISTLTNDNYHDIAEANVRQLGSNKHQEYQQLDAKL